MAYLLHLFSKVSRKRDRKDHYYSEVMGVQLRFAIGTMKFKSDISPIKFHTKTIRLSDLDIMNTLWLMDYHFIERTGYLKINLAGIYSSLGILPFL